jgi:hypothetical protein
VSSPPASGDDDDDNDDDEKCRLSPRRPPADSGPWRPLLLPRVPTCDTSIETSTRRGTGAREEVVEEEKERSDRTDIGCRKPVCAGEFQNMWYSARKPWKILLIGP